MATKVATLNKERDSAEERCRQWVDKLKAKQKEVQRLKGELEKVAEEVVKKYNEHLDDIGMQSWLVRIKAMKNMLRGSM